MREIKTLAQATKAFAKYLEVPCDGCGVGVGVMCVENPGVWIHAERFKAYWATVK